MRHKVGIALAIVCMLLMTAVVVNEERRLGKVSKALGNEHTFLTESCERLNIIRAEANASYYADYKFDATISTDIKFNLTHRRQTPLERKQTKGFIKVVDSSLSLKTWTPLTNCKAAVNSLGVHYRAPEPVHFVDALPPENALKPPPA